MYKKFIRTRSLDKEKVLKGFKLSVSVHKVVALIKNLILLILCQLEMPDK